jgi:hypothetical protein
MIRYRVISNGRSPRPLPWILQLAKEALVAAVPLAHPLPRAVLALATDASDTHVGAVLQQQVGQHWQPLGFFSKKLSKSEVNYSTFDRELLGAVSGIKHRDFATAAGVEWVCAAIADNLKDMALRQILCPHVQALRSSPGLRIITHRRLIH